jgi:hypothetical protein
MLGTQPAKLVSSRQSVSQRGKDALNAQLSRPYGTTTVDESQESSKPFGKELRALSASSRAARRSGGSAFPRVAFMRYERVRPDGFRW